MRSAVAALLVAAAACGSGEGHKAPPNLPQAKLERADTAGDSLLAMVPSGAQVVFELDLARLRANEVVGPLYGRLAAQLPPRYAGLEDADVVVLAGYTVGESGSRGLLIVRGGTAPEAAMAIDETTAAVGPPELIERLEALQAGHGESVADDAVFMKLRDTAMPAKAKAASLRLTAHLGFDARVGLANLFSADAVPSGLSLWGDVVDDFAMVAVLSGEDDTDGESLADLINEWRSWAARHQVVRQMALSSLFARVEVEHAGNIARATFVIGPRALDKVARRLDRRLALR